MEHLIYDLPLSVRYGEVGPQGRLQLSALGNWLQEAAGRSADSLGFGEYVLAQRGITWILTRLVLRIHALPGAGQVVHVRTWPSHVDHLAYRGFALCDEEGNTLVSGTSGWMVMEIASHKLSAMPEFLLAKYPPSAPDCEAFSSRTLPRLPKPLCAAPIVARRDDLDLNAHVNNARYLSWLLECLPQAATGLIPRLVDITFRAECFPGDVLQSLCGFPADGEGGTRIVHALRRESGEDVCRAVTEWAQNPLAE